MTDTTGGTGSPADIGQHLDGDPLHEPTVDVRGGQPTEQPSDQPLEGSPDLPSDDPWDEPADEPEDGVQDTVERLREAAEDDNEKKRAARSFWKELPILILIALIVAVLIKAFLFQAFFIPSGSMLETLQIDDRVLVNKLSYRFSDPDRADVIVFDRNGRTSESVPSRVVRNVAEAVGLSTPESDLIKRVIGLPGETIEIRNSGVLIDGVAIDEPYLEPGIFMGDYGPELVPEDSYFVMGDNRNQSRDSRFDGPVERDQIVGRAFVIIWPPSRWGGL